MARQAFRATTAVLFAVTATGACALPAPTARSSADYGKKAAHTAEEVRSAVETTIVALRAQRDDKVPVRTLDVVVTEAEADAGGAASTFRSIDPPSSSDADRDLRDRAIELVDGAVDELEQVRLDVRLGRTARVAEHVGDLEELADDLDRFADEVGS
jgi:hypothetical protein